MHRVEHACIPLDNNVDVCVVNLQQKPIEILDGWGISQLFENKPVKASDQNCAVWVWWTEMVPECNRYLCWTGFPDKFHSRGLPFLVRWWQYLRVQWQEDIWKIAEMPSYPFGMSLPQHVKLVTELCEACGTTWRKPEVWTGQSARETMPWRSKRWIIVRVVITDKRKQTGTLEPKGKESGSLGCFHETANGHRGSRLIDGSYSVDNYLSYGTW